MAKKEKGFSLVEIVIAIIIMATGLVALAGALVVGITLPKRARQQEVAKQLANEIMESIIFAKESQPSGYTTFDAISYADSNSLGRFISSSGNANITKMLVAGPDGVYGTCDDGTTGVYNPVCGSLGTQLVMVDVDPGPDGKYQAPFNVDNTKLPLLNFTRQVEITDINNATKQIDVTVNYPNPLGGRDKVVLSTQITNFRLLSGS